MKDSSHFKENSHLHALIWWLVILMFLFFGYVAWDLGFVETLFVKDRSHLTKAIALLTTIASLHAAWHIIRYSYFSHSELSNISALLTLPDSASNDSLVPLEIIADRIRAPVEAGWFMVDLAIRIGLAGTIIGFILIFSSLSGAKIVGEDALQQLLVSMSVGMGTALFTTLAGLIAATFLSVQYMVLGRQSEHLLAKLVMNRVDR